LPHQYGCTAVETVAGFGGLSVHVEARALPSAAAEERPLGLAYVIGDPATASAMRGATSTAAALMQTSLEVPPRQTLVLYVCNLGDADADELPVATDLELRISSHAPDAGTPILDDAGEADAGTTREPGTMPPACGCQQGKGPKGMPADNGPFGALRPYAGGVMTLVFLLVFLRRVLGVRRRRRLYEADRQRKNPSLS
ncbi:MAG: hypothetical protein ACO3JL_20895, partial [Myxococcota bacterium]